MCKTFIKVGLFIFALIFIANSHTSFAMTTDLSITNDQSKFNIINITPVQQKKNKAENNQSAQKKAEAKPAKKIKVVPRPQKYTIVSGDSLIKIAKTYKTTWERVFDKNIKISDPNSINPGEVIIIPTTTEKLAKRVVVETLPKLTAAVANVSQTIQNMTPANYTPHSGSSAGNTYTAGYCTWYAKNRRPDLPNSLGNAGAWVSNASAQGIPTGNTPRAGAIGQQGNHVVYIEKVNGNGTVSISEMNYGGGLFVVNHRTAPTSNFVYIY